MLADDGVIALTATSSQQNVFGCHKMEQGLKKKLYIRLLRIRQRMGIFWPLMINGTVLFIIFILGSLGYKYIEGWPLSDGFYMVLINFQLSDLVKLEDPLNEQGKLLTSAVIISGVVHFALLIGYFVQLASRRTRFSNDAEGRVDKAIAALSDHCILCGYGLRGRVVAAELAADGVDVVVAETDDKKAEEEIESAGYFFVLGDATSDSVMMRVGLDRAKAFLVASIKPTTLPTCTWCSLPGP